MPSQYEIFFWGGKEWKKASWEGNTFATTVYRKPTFGGVYTHFDRFLPTTYKISMIYTLVFKCFSICSNWNNFHNELVFLKNIFLKNGYPISFIDKCFKTFLDWLYLKRPQVLTDEKKTLTLVPPFLGKLSLQTRTKLQKVLKRTLSCSKIKIVFKNQINLSNVFPFKDRLPYHLMSCVVYKFQCGRCNASYYDETDRHLKIRSGEHIGISHLTVKKVKPSAESSICDHLLFCNHDPSFDDFTILTQEINVSIRYQRKLINQAWKNNIKQKHQFGSIILIWQVIIWLDNFIVTNCILLIFFTVYFFVDLQEKLICLKMGAAALEKLQ